MNESIQCVDAMVLLDNKTAFNSFIRCTEVDRINLYGGLRQSDQVSLYETNDRKIPDTLKDGEALITDVLVKLEPNVAINLN